MTFTRGFSDFVSECVHGMRCIVPAANDQVWLTLGSKPSQRINRWALLSRVSLVDNPTGAVLLEVSAARLAHITGHRLNQRIGPGDVITLITSTLPVGAVTYAENGSGGNSQHRYSNQLLAVLPSLRGRGRVQGLSPCLVLELQRGQVPHLTLVTGYWCSAQKAAALTLSALK